MRCDTAVFNLSECSFINTISARSTWCHVLCHGGRGSARSPSCGLVSLSSVSRVMCSCSVAGHAFIKRWTHYELELLQLINTHSNHGAGLKFKGRCFQHKNRSLASHNLPFAKFAKFTRLIKRDPDKCLTPWPYMKIVFLETTKNKVEYCLTCFCRGQLDFSFERLLQFLILWESQKFNLRKRFIDVSVC